jgi:Flp pilus assembly protein TadB
MKSILLLALLCTAMPQIQAQYSGDRFSRKGLYLTGANNDPQKEREQKMREEAARAAAVETHTPEEWSRIYAQIRLQVEAEAAAAQKVEAEQQAARKIEMDRVAALRKIKTTLPTPKISSVNSERTSERVSVQEPDWTSTVFGMVICIAIGVLGLILVVLWILFPVFVYQYLKRLVLAQEESNRFLRMMTERTPEL